MRKPSLVARYVHAPREARSLPGSKLDAPFRALEDGLARVFDEGHYFAQHPPAVPRKSVELNLSEVAARISWVLDNFSEEYDAATLLRRLPYATGWRLELDYSQKPSAGQEVLFSQILRVSSAARPKALILIDEPEMALHPQWQSNFIPLLREYIPDELGMHVILATHSPFLVGEADSVVAASHLGFVQLEADFGTLSIDAIVYQAFGASNSGSVIIENDLSVILAYVSDEISSDLPSIEVEAAAKRLQARRTDSTDLLAAALDEFERTVGRRQRKDH